MPFIKIIGNSCKKRKIKRKKWAQNTKAAWIIFDPKVRLSFWECPSGLCGKESSGKVFSVSQDALIELSNRCSAKYCRYKKSEISQEMNLGDGKKIIIMVLYP